MSQAELLLPASGDEAHVAESKPADKAPGAFKTISEAADMLGVPQHVLRFWESKFPQIKPMKRKGGRRFYRPEDMDMLVRIQQLLYKQGYTIKGARQAIEQKVATAPKPQEPIDLSKVQTIRLDQLLAAKQQGLVVSDRLRVNKSEIEQLVRELGEIRDVLKSCA